VLNVISRMSLEASSDHPQVGQVREL